MGYSHAYAYPLDILMHMHPLWDILMDMHSSRDILYLIFLGK